MQSMCIMWKYESISANYLTNIYIHTHKGNYIYVPVKESYGKPRHILKSRDTTLVR